jgi:hypothetical protein
MDLWNDAKLKKHSSKVNSPDIKLTDNIVRVKTMTLRLIEKLKEIMNRLPA